MASLWCKERGMRLAQFETREEMKVVLENAPESEWYWLGASDVGFAPGDFHCSDGGRVAPEFWRSNEPDSHGAGRETCVDVKPGHKKLCDEGCTNPERPLCEVLRELHN